jgi:acyl dehydratase
MEAEMSRQLFFEDVTEGEDTTPLVKQPTTTQLVMWAGASGDYNPIHYDKDYAVKQGLPGVIVHGQLAGAFLGQMLTDWMSDQGCLKKLSLSYKGKNLPGEPIICRGTVTRKYTEDNNHLIALNIWAENPRGEKTLTGTALVTLPAKG